MVRKSLACFLFLFLVLAGLAFAQDDDMRSAVDYKISKMKIALKLTDDQAAALKPVLKDYLTRRNAYLQEYAPSARERGMVLLHDWLSPALLLKEGHARLTFIWSVAGMEGWWQMRLTASFDPTIEAFWQKLRPGILARTRRFYEAAGKHV